MEGQTKVTWDFLDAAFRAGALDEFVRLSRTLADKKYENQALLFADLEDAVSERDDLGAIDDALEEAFRLMPALSDPEVMEGLTYVVSLLNPLLESLIESQGRDVVVEKVTALKDNLPKVSKAMLTLLLLNSKQILAAFGEKGSRDYGVDAGNAMNRANGWINELNARDPRAILDFMAGLFSTVDKKQASAAADVMMDAFLAQDPPLFRWTVAAIFRRARRRLLGR